MINFFQNIKNGSLSKIQISDTSLTEKKVTNTRNKVKSNIEESLLLNGLNLKRERLFDGTNFGKDLNNRSVNDKHIKNLDNSIANISVDNSKNSSFKKK